MEISRFGNNKTGTLAKISTPQGGQDHAFIPDPLPTKWTFDPALWPLLAEAKQRLGELNGVARMLPNPELLLKPLQRVESLTSSRLEGTYASAEQVMLFELNPTQPQSSTDETNSWLEVHNHMLALVYGYRQLEKLPFCLRVIKELHRILLEGVRGATTRLGEFREQQVHIGSNRRYVPPPPGQQTDSCMFALENYLNTPNDEFDPLVRCFLAHYQLEAIHPFSDGNGRIGRVVLSLMIYKWCNLTMPWLYLSPYFERYKDEYINNLFKVSSEGAWSNWIEFCLTGVIEQSTKATETCRDLHLLKKDMHERTEKDGRARIHGIIDDLFESPFVQIGELAKRNGVYYPTAKSDVEYLMKKEILIEISDSRIKTFFAPEIYRVAYPNEQAVEEKTSL
jgi:Fic family protein